MIFVGAKARERIEQLITDLDTEDERIVIRPPVLCSLSP
jgi:hypothetical protein